jgi:hypothetical protein
MAALCGSLCAQTKMTVTIRILDGKTGKPVPATGFLVRIDHQKTVHADWVAQNEDGAGKLTLPQGASLLSIHGTYDDSMLTYVNCDSAAEKANPIDRWYAISEIVASGIVTPDGCVKPGMAPKLKPVAKPGEFVLLVRRMTTREQWRE